MSAKGPVPRLTHSDVEHIRHARRRSTLLFITDRCPVGCAHCSVDSRVDSPTITDFGLFGEIVDWLCSDPQIEVVGISGGEPFVERRGLTFASCRLEEAGKLQVIYTSGVWAVSPSSPAWINDVLGRCSCVYLSTDAFHARAVTEKTYVRAARAVADAGAWIVVQVLGIDRMAEQAEKLLSAAFGELWKEFAELNVIKPLTHGRGARVFAPGAHFPGHAFGPCSLVTSPMVRYDGLVTGCCNESVIMGLGPARLRRRAQTKDEVASAIAGFHRDPLLRAMGGAGLGALTLHPRFSDLAHAEFANVCQLCWKMLARSSREPESDPLVDAINAMVEL